MSKKLKLCQPGTKRLVTQYGAHLVCVRCHYDAGHSNRFKTIELKEAFLSQPGAQEAVLDGVEANLHPQSSEAFIRQCGAILTHDTMDRLSDISAPTHVIAGAEDIVHPARSAKVLAERIPGAELTIVPNVGHALCWEDPIRFNEAVLSFIARRPVAA